MRGAQHPSPSTRECGLFSSRDATKPDTLLHLILAKQADGGTGGWAFHAQAVGSKEPRLLLMWRQVPATALQVASRSRAEDIAVVKGG
jgi:hypothetical protein